MNAPQELSTIKYLPTVHQLKDAQQGGPLEALLQVIDEQVQHVSTNVSQMYEDWFVETCRPEFVPYIGEMLGGSVSENLLQGSQASTRNRALGMIFPRREVAEAISLQRRKGTLPVLEELAMIVARWYAHAEEWYPRVAQFQDVRRQPIYSKGLAVEPVLKKKEERQVAVENKLLGMGQTVDVRKFYASGSLEGPFDQGAYFSDFKPPRKDFYPKNANLIRLHLYRLKPYRITQGRPRCVASIDLKCGETRLQVFTFDAVGLCRALYVNPILEDAPTDIANESNLPVLLTRELLTKPYPNASVENNQSTEEESVKKADESKSPSDSTSSPNIDAAKQNPCISLSPECCKSIASNVFYGRGKSLELRLEQFGRTKSEWWREFIPSERILVCDLSWALCSCGKKGCDCNSDATLQAKGCKSVQDLEIIETIGGTPLISSSSPIVAIDPENGLIALKYRDSDSCCRPEVLGTFYYGFSGDMGGGEYIRSSPRMVDAAAKMVRVRRDRTKCKGRDNLHKLACTLLNQEEVSNCRIANATRTVVEIADSDSYFCPCRQITVKAGTTLEIRAASQCSPTIKLQGTACKAALTFQLEPGANVILDGLRIFNGKIVFSEIDSKVPQQAKDCCGSECSSPMDPTRRITLRHCTFVPNVEIGESCCRKNVPTIIENAIADSVLTIDHCITSKLMMHSKPKPNRLLVLDSIVDGQGLDDVAICGSESTILKIERSTVLGKTSVREIELAQDTVFSCSVTVARKQPGGMRFCFVPQNCELPTWKTPQQYYCQPSQTYERLNLQDKKCSNSGSSSQVAFRLSKDPAQEPDDTWRDIRLSFTSCNYGHAGYGQLRILNTTPSKCDSHVPCKCKGEKDQHIDASPIVDCPCRSDVVCSAVIRRGAESGSEMGAFHDLYQPQREDNLRRRIEEFTPMPMNTELLFVN